VRPDAVQKTIEEIHGRFAGELDDLLSIHLPEGTDRRFRAFFDGLGLAERPIPDWVMSFYHVQEALMTAYYHRRNIERIERAAIEVLRRALGDESHQLPRANMSVGARTLSAEYQAYLLALRRAFEYLGGGLSALCGVPRDYFPKLPRVLKAAEPAETTARLGSLIRRTVNDFKDPFGLRNFLTHEGPVSAGQFHIDFEPGEPAAIKLVDTGGGLHELGSLGPDEPRLGIALDRQLELAEDRIFEFIAELSDLDAA
jgi:hypothetical protein